MGREYKHLISAIIHWLGLRLGCGREGGEKELRKFIKEKKWKKENNGCKGHTNHSRELSDLL